jgi:hypothetical protein
MADRPHNSARDELRSNSTAVRRTKRRTYQKPRIERFVAKSLILGNVTGTPDGLSGGERLTKP